MTLTPADLPKWKELVLPTVRAAAELNGEFSAAVLREQVHTMQGHTPEQRSVMYPSGHSSPVLDNRLDFARSRCANPDVGLLERRGHNRYAVTELGLEVADMSDDDADERITQLEHEAKATEAAAANQGSSGSGGDGDGGQPASSAGDDWCARIIERLKQLPPFVFEQFVVFLLGHYNMDLDWQEGQRDKGVDALGRHWCCCTDFLSTVVAVQCKRWNPSGPNVSGANIAQFQKQAQDQGAQRLIYVTLTGYASGAIAQADTIPNVDLLKGCDLCRLMREKGVGAIVDGDTVTIDEAFFASFPD